MDAEVTKPKVIDSSVSDQTLKLTSGANHIRIHRCLDAVVAATEDSSFC
jgi:hypothetical protein